MFPHRVSESIVLRAFRDHDAPGLFELVDRNRAYLREWMPWLDGNTSAEGSRLFIRTTLDSFAETGAITCGIWNDGVLCGVIGYYAIDWQERSTNLGYWLSEDHQGRGIVTLCCRCLIDYAFHEYGLEKIIIRVAPGNARSQAIPDRLGFVRHDVLPDAEWLYDHFVDHTVNVLHRPTG